MSLHVFKSECDWVVAESPDDAWAAWREFTGESREDYEDEIEFEAEPDDNLLTIWNDDTDFNHCECRAKIEAHKATVDKQVKAIEAQPAVARAVLWGVEKSPPAHPNGHLVGCDVGQERKTCGQWAAEGRGFLCSTEY